MARKLLAVATILIIVAVAFGLVSYASGSASQPKLRPNVPAAKLPTSPLTDAQSIPIYDLIGQDAASRFGITTDSFAQARRIAPTEAGDLELIPGTSGACLALPSAVACGDPGAPGQPILALFRNSNGDYVGGGITNDVTTSVTIKRPNAQSVAVAVHAGVFVVSAATGIAAQPGVQIVSDGSGFAVSPPSESLKSSGLATVSAVSHCTHYSYPYSIDSNCFQYWPIGYSQWTTTQGGFRDSNHSVTQDVRTWNLWYQYADGTFCTNCVSGGGIGLYGSIGGSGGEYVEAACGIGPPPNSQYGYGYCMTYWHS